MKLQELDDVEGKPGFDTHNYAYLWEPVRAKFVLSKVVTSVQNLVRAIESVVFDLANHTHTDANENTFVGDGAFDSNTIGFGNVAFGKDSLTANTTGEYNVGLGWTTLANNTTGGANMSLGKEALRDNVDGSNNTAIGSAALRENVSGNGNVAIGSTALSGNTTGEGNLAIGTNAGLSSSADGCIYLGNNSGISNAVDDQLIVTNNITLPLIQGTMAALAANQDLAINAQDVTLPGIPTTSSATVWKDGTFLRYGTGDSFNESAQDAVGGILTDTATIDFTYTDATPTITADVINDSITDTKLRNSGALSVIGRSANTSGDPADISATAATDSVLRESGSTIGFGTIATAGIANNAVTDTKIRDSGALSVIGRSANSSGDPADISAVAASGSVLRESGSTIGFGTITSATISNFTEAAQDAVAGAFVDTATVSLDYNDGIDEITASVIADSITDTYLRNSTALSVIGRSANTTGDPADISAVAASGSVLRESGSTIGFGTIATAGIADNAVTNAKIRDGGALSVIGRSANSSGDPADISAVAASDSVLRESGSTIGFGTIATGGIAANAVTNAKLAQMTQTTVKGRADAAGTGDPTDLTAAQLNTIVGTTALTMANGISIATDAVTARDSGGLSLKDDGNNYGVFVEDGGQVGINTGSPAAPLHVEATAVASTAEEIARFTVSDDATAYLKIINSTSGDAAFVPVIETLAASTSAARVDLAKITTDTGTTPGFIIDVRTAAGAAVTTRPIVDYRTFGSSRMLIMGSGEVGIGDTTPDGKLDVVQGSTTAAIPTLELEQTDLSEEFINFVTTVAVNNPVDATTAVGTAYARLRVAVNGTFKYIQLYNA